MKKVPSPIKQIIIRWSFLFSFSDKVVTLLNNNILID